MARNDKTVVFDDRDNRWHARIGAVWLVAGGVAMIAPLLIRPAGALFFGAVLSITGAAQIAHAMRNGYWRAPMTEGFAGAILAGTGATLLIWRPDSIATLALVLAGYLAAEGVSRLIIAVRFRHAAEWQWTAFAGLAAISFAVLAGLGFPAASVWVLGLFTGLHLALGGWGLIALARANKRSP